MQEELTFYSTEELINFLNSIDDCTIVTLDVVAAEGGESDG